MAAHEVGTAGGARESGRGARRGAFRRAGLAAAVVATALLVFGASPWATPAAAQSKNPYKKVYTLELEHGRPKRVKLGSEPDVQNYWYIPFTITNNDPEEHALFIDVSAESDKGVTYRPLVQPHVKEMARKKLGLKPFTPFWSVEELTTAHEEQPLPKDGQGFPTEVKLPKIEANATIQCVAIFHGPDREMDKLIITFRGLSNDVMVRKTDRPHERVLAERVLRLEYRRPGDEFFTNEDPIELHERRWEIVETVVKTDLD